MNTKKNQSANKEGGGQERNVGKDKQVRCWLLLVYSEIKQLIPTIVQDCKVKI